jgi:NAD(P)-dependent dehydrogenase (short-subunit alcohol dehydrogenase family)
MDDTLRFDGRVAIVTGAGRGIGRSHAELLADLGAQVVVNDIGGSIDGGGGDGAGPAIEVVRAIEAAGGTAVADTNDVSTPEGAAALIASAVDSFGRLDVVVNNAGILRDRQFASLSRQDIESVIGVHLLGAMWATQAAWPHFRRQGGGRVVNTTSVAGYLGNFGQANYGAAKMGIVGLTKVLAIEGVRHDIRVNAVAPGASTRMNEHLLGDYARLLGPERVSPLVAYLAHADCPVSGEVFLAGGGRVARLVIGQTAGYFAEDLTAESLRDHWGTVMDTDGFLMPTSFPEEFDILKRCWAAGER